MATKMIERHYSLSWRDFTRVPVEHLMTVLERERTRVLADGNQQVLVDLDYDDENRARVHLVGIRPETPAEQSKREAKEAEQQERITAGTNYHLKESFKTRTKEEVLALWEEAQKK
jgi:hypothetical protein